MSSRVGRGPLLIVTALLYLLLGAAGLSLAVAPGYASPIFPAAGLAVAAMLWSHGRALPGIWLGSLCLNLGVAWLRGGLHLEPVLLAFGISLGATVQAAVAWWLVRRYVPRAWRRLETEGHVLRTLLLAGPLACLVSATTGVTLLVLSGTIAFGDFPYAWWNWWSGDTFGVTVMLPLGLALFLRRDPLWRARRIPVVLPMSIALALVAAAFLAVSRWEQELARSTVREHGENLEQALRDRFVAHQESLSALRRLIEVNPDMSFAEFEHFTRITLRDNPDIFALSINPYILASQRAAFEKTYAQRLNDPGFMIRERDSQRQLVRAGERPRYIAVGYIAPLPGNRAAVGFDIHSEPVRREAIERALASGEAAVTAPIQLVQESRPRVGVLLLHPASQQEFPAGRRGAISAFAVGVIKVDEMLEIVARKLLQPGLEIHLHDAQAPADKATFFSTRSEGARVVNELRWRSDIPVAGRVWRLEILPTAEFIRKLPHWLGFAVGLGGLTFASLLQILLLGMTGRTAVVQRQVREQTAQLTAKGQALEDRNAQLDALFSLSPDGLLAFDPDGRVRFVNPAFGALTGISPEAASGASETLLEDMLRQRLAAPEQFRGLAAYFPGEGGEPPVRDEIHLRQPPLVLEMIGLDNPSATISRILYVRDLTRDYEVNRLKSEFLSHAAHQLRTPLTSVLGFSELLLKMELEEATRRDLLETIHRQANWLVDIINELLDLSRIEERRGQDLQIVPLDLAVFLPETVASLGVDTARWPIGIDLTGVHATRVLADAAKLRQALNNVLSNACKYSPDGGAIGIRLRQKAGRTGIVVRDHGIGMTREQLGRFGERFWRADVSGNTLGTGLGVAIVIEILRLLGGSLESESEFGQGTQLTLWLPRAPSAG